MILRSSNHGSGRLGEKWLRARLGDNEGDIRRINRINRTGLPQCQLSCPYGQAEVLRSSPPFFWFWMMTALLPVSKFLSPAVVLRGSGDNDVEVVLAAEC